MKVLVLIDGYGIDVLCFIECDMFIFVFDEIIVCMYVVMFNYCDLEIVFGMFFMCFLLLLILLLDGVGEVVVIGENVMCVSIGDCVVGIFW